MRSSPCPENVLRYLWLCHAATVLWLPLRAYTFLVRSSPSEAAESPLGEAALLLLLVLLHHAPSAKSGQLNSFRRAFTGMQVRLHLCLGKSGCVEAAVVCIQI